MSELPPAQDLNSRPQPPETGSHRGIHLRGGVFGDREGLPLPEAFRGGALYCVYLRALTADGTLSAALEHLDRIVALGASAVWLLPLHPVGNVGRKGSVGSPYAIRDYRAVDPAYGTMDDLRRFADAAHERGLKVILDFVANHAANDHPFVELYPEYFARDAEGRPTRRVADWSDVADWNHAEQGVTHHLVGSALHWIWDVGLDGFRCDVAGMVPHAFWEKLREELVKVRPDYFLLAEWQDAEHHTLAFHASYDWMLYRALRDVAKGKADAVKVDRALAAWQANFPPEAVPLRFLENHDEPRILSILKKERLPAFAVTVFLSGGLPLVYTGQEIGETHRPSLFEAEPVDWDAGDPSVTELYRELIALQRKADPWGPGPVRHLKTNRGREVLAFEREGASRQGLVVANLGTRERKVSIISGFSQGWSFRRVWGTEGETWSEGDVVTLAPGAAWVGESA